MMPTKARPPIDGRPPQRPLGQDGDGDAHEPVGAQLQQHRREDHRALGRGLGVGVGQPGVEREHGHLDAEPHEHAAEHQDLRGTGDVLECRPARPVPTMLKVSPPVRKNSARKLTDHQRRTEQGEQEEFDGGVLALLAAPHADHEVHRQQHDLEEHEEQDQVLSDEGADHAGVQDQDEDQERLGVVRLREVVPAVDHHQRHDQQRERISGMEMPSIPSEAV